jgi:hypothetical protein
MSATPRCAIGVPNVGAFGDPSLLVNLAVAAEEHGWDGFFVWDHLLWWDPGWYVADPVVVIAAVAARTARIRIGILVNLLARRRAGKVGTPVSTAPHPGRSTWHWRGAPTAPRRIAAARMCSRMSGPG